MDFRELKSPFTLKLVVEVLSGSVWRNYMKNKLFVPTWEFQSIRPKKSGQKNGANPERFWGGLI